MCSIIVLVRKMGIYHNYRGCLIVTVLQQLIKKSPFTQGEIAKMLGITQPWLSQVAAGKKKPGKWLAKELANLFGVTVEDLKL